MTVAMIDGIHKIQVYSFYSSNILVQVLLHLLQYPSPVVLHLLYLIISSQGVLEAIEPNIHPIGLTLTESTTASSG